MTIFHQDYEVEGQQPQQQQIDKYYQEIYLTQHQEHQNNMGEYCIFDIFD